VFEISIYSHNNGLNEIGCYKYKSKLMHNADDNDNSLILWDLSGNFTNYH
jgi:hypothetical protein